MYVLQKKAYWFYNKYEWMNEWEFNHYFNLYGNHQDHSEQIKSPRIKRKGNEGFYNIKDIWSFKLPSSELYAARSIACSQPDSAF